LENLDNKGNLRRVPNAALKSVGHHEIDGI